MAKDRQSGAATHDEAPERAWRTYERCQGVTGGAGLECPNPALYVVATPDVSDHPKGACGLHLAPLVKYKLSNLTTVTVRTVWHKDVWHKDAAS